MAEQLALTIFDEFKVTGAPITDSSHDIGYNKSNLMIDVSDLGLAARRTLNACHFIAAQNPGKGIYDVEREFFKWLINYSGSNNHAHLQRVLREAQKAAVMVNTVDALDPAKDTWISVPMLGPAALAKGRVMFKIPEELRKHLSDPESYTYLSLRITAAFSSSYALELYEKLSSVRFKGGTDWMEIERFRDWMGADKKTLTEFKNLKRYVIVPSLEQINQLSDIFVRYEIRNAGPSKRITHIRFLVQPNPNGKFNLQARANHQLAIKDLYDALVRDFGLSTENLDEIMAHRDEWTDERIQAAIDFTRHRLGQKKRGKVEYPGLYLMNAIRKNLSLAGKEKPAPENRSDGAGREEEARTRQAEQEGVSAGLELFGRMDPDSRKALCEAFRNSSVGRYAIKLAAVEFSEEALLGDARLRLSFGKFVLDHAEGGGERTVSKRARRAAAMV